MVKDEIVSRFPEVLAEAEFGKPSRKLFSRQAGIRSTSEHQAMLYANGADMSGTAHHVFMPDVGLPKEAGLVVERHVVGWGYCSRILEHLDNLGLVFRGIREHVRLEQCHAAILNVVIAA